MELLVNNLSFHGQFSDIAAFRKSLGLFMQMKNLARRFGVEIYSHRNIATVYIMPDMPIRKAVQYLSEPQRRSLMLWLTKQGPFWDEEKFHGPDDYLECNDEIVTDTAVGEAAYCHLQGVERCLVSLTPSDWDSSPLVVKWHKIDNCFKAIEILNYCCPDDLESTLSCTPNIESWNALIQEVGIRCTYLKFAPNSFENLRKYPFNPCAAKNLLQRLEILDRLQNSFDAQGKHTAEGHQILGDYFTGNTAWFSDSSNTERNAYRARLTFPHPEHERETLFCPWHGKVNHHPPLRIHFSWPIRVATPCYVVYVGPKLTMKS